MSERTTSAPPWYHLDNVFPSRARMDWAHRPIVVLAARTLRERAGAVVDLGCGNGALLKKIHALAPHAVPFGVEALPERVVHARALLPAFARNLLQGDLHEDPARWGWDVRFRLAMVTPRRLEDIGPEPAARLLAWIRERCDRLLVYAYGTGRTQYGDLRGFARVVGIDLEAGPPSARAAFARRW